MQERRLFGLIVRTIGFAFVIYSTLALFHVGTKLFGLSVPSRISMTGILYGHATKAQMTAIYVKENPLGSLRSLYPGRRTSHQGFQITDKLLADQFDPKVEAQIAFGSKPENAFLTAADRGNYDPLVMGVLLRPTEQQLYLRARGRTHSAQCALRRCGSNPSGTHSLS
jgi:hypothetical protein